MSSLLRLRTHEVPSALAGIDAPRTVVDELVWREVGDSGDTAAWRAGGWRLDPGGDTGAALLWHERDHHGMLLPAAGLRAVRAAALTVTATRMFLYSRVVTASVLGSGLAARVLVTELAAHVPGVSDIAVHAPDGQAVPGCLADDLELAGVGLTSPASVEDTVFGANLVILACPAEDDWQPPRGSLVVNATGQPSSAHVLAMADQVFTDEDAPPGRTRLGQVFAGTHPGRHAADDIVLVDLPGVHAGGVWLAYRLYEAAQREGLGVPARTPEPGGK